MAKAKSKAKPKEPDKTKPAAKAQTKGKAKPKSAGQSVTAKELKRLTESIPGGIVVLEINPKKSGSDSVKVVYYNDGFFDFSGYSREECKKMFADDPLCLIFDEDKPAILDAVAKLKENGEEILCSYRCHTKDGGYRWFDIKGTIVEQRGDIYIVNAVKFDVTERKEAEDNLRISEEQFRIAASVGDRIIARYDIKAQTYYNNDENMLLLKLGDKVENVPQTFIDRGDIAPECVTDYLEFYKKIRRGEKSCSMDVAILGKDDEYHWYHCDATVIFDGNKEPSQAILAFTDIGEQREKEAVYRKWQQSLQQRSQESFTLFRFNLSKNTVLDSAEGSLLRIEFSEDAMTFNERTREYRDQFVFEEDRQEYETILNSDTLLADYYRGDTIKTLEFREIVQDGEFRWLRMTVELVEYPNSSEIEAYLMYEDIDDSKRAELKAQEMSQIDPLTGVLNRAAFIRKMNEIIEKDSKARHTLLMMDIDGFKNLNDVFGHATGDEVLADIAKSLSSVLRHEDLLGRLGGDEFVICLRDIPYDGVIDKKARQICLLVRKAFSLDVQISTSIGIAVYPRDGENFDELYRKADAALYSVKDSGKDNFAYYSRETDSKPESDEEAQSTVSLNTSSEATSKRQMLIVDDNAVSRELLSKIFEDDFSIKTANDGNSALIRLRHYGAGISVVLLDLTMPGMDGFAVLERMQESIEMRSVPVIVVSAHSDRETNLRVVKCGAADFVSKPVDPDLIKIRVQSAISKAENERLRAQNSYLLLQSGEEAKYRTVLDSTGTIVIEYDWINGIFTYDRSISQHIAGKYDNRKLWRIFMSDMIADALDVKDMQELVHEIANDRQREIGTMMVKLKTPSNGKQWFRMRVFKRVDEFELTDKMLITYVNVNEEVLAEERLRFQAEHDRLTGLYSREVFFEKAAEMIAKQPEKYYVMACFDINNFKIINDQYGSEKGDLLLQHIARVFKEGFEKVGGICCRIMADNFAVLYPSSFMTSAELDTLREKASYFDESIPKISFSIGRYIVADRSLPVSTLYERAAIAEATIKGRVDVDVMQYDESMWESILHQQEIIDEMDGALKDNQFEVWLQPQYNHASGALIGAEALVRWRHPEKGIVPPDDFIPIFEKNGFIYEMDKFVWEQTCRVLRRWIDDGRAPLPVSVNISRYDLFRDDLIKVITGLIKKYDIPVDMLRLEITESAFAESTEQIITVVKSLIKQGFTIEIDDFGSGYSSFNTLKDVPAQILKLDMRFLEIETCSVDDSCDESSSRGGNILESIVRMTKWLGMSVIAEGVETKEQADFLKSIGGNYVQGYLYAKPMPLEEYEELTKNAETEEELSTLKTVVNLDNNAFWDPASMDTLIFNSYVGGACIFEYYMGKVEILRATDKYAHMIGGADMTVEDVLKLDWQQHLDEENLKLVSMAIDRSIKNRDEVSEEFVFRDIPGCPEKIYLRSSLRVIATAGERYLVYATNENITAQREAEKKESRLAEQMKKIMDNINGGVSAVTIDKKGKIRFVFTNDRYYSMLGYTREQFETEIYNAFEVLHPDDLEETRKTVANVLADRRSASYEYRCFRRDGEIIHLRCNASIISMEGIGDDILLSVITDITAEKKAEDDLRMSREQFRIAATSGGRVIGRYDINTGTYYNDDEKWLALGLGRRVENVPQSIIDSKIVYPPCAKEVAEFYDKLKNGEKTCSIDFALLAGEGKYQWLHCDATVIFDSQGQPSQAIMVFVEIDSKS